MSKRHSDNRPARDPKEVRRLQHRRLRHQVDQTLHEAADLGVTDLDAVVLAEPRVPRVSAGAAPKGRVRHWKLKSWKRRTAARAERNAALSALVHAN